MPADEMTTLPVTSVHDYVRSAEDLDAGRLGLLHGKMSALRWVLGSEWDFLDT